MRINKREEQLRRVIEGELLEDVIEQTPVEPVTVEAAITYM